MTALPASDVVLLGIGHTNAHVLRMWRREPVRGARLTCISNQPVMVAWLLSRLGTIGEPALYGWVLAVIVVCSLSLMLDVTDVLRYLRGRRAPTVVLEALRADCNAAG